MRKTVYFLWTFILLLTACSEEKTDFTLKGQIDGLPSDTILVYYQVPDYKTDTLYCEKGAFEYSFTPDTTTMFSLILNEEKTLPVFAQKGETVEVSGKIDSLQIKGKGDNALMNEIFALLEETPKRKLRKKVDSLIQANQYSFTNLYLIDKYYTQNSAADIERLEDLIEGQSGMIKDTYYIMGLQSRMEDLRTEDRNRNIYSLSGKDRDGEPIKWNSVRDQYILVDLWASWDPQSVAEQDSLVKVLKELKKKKFRVFSVSLDMDKEAWLKASDRDTTQWVQVCDFKGWNSPLIKSQGIHSLPCNILLDKGKRIIARDIRGQELIDKVKNLIKEDEEREKQRKQAAKRRKRK